MSGTKKGFFYYFANKGEESFSEGKILREEVFPMAKRQANGEVITGGDFRRMVTGAYSEFLLEYENLNRLDQRLRPAHGGRPGTDILRTMGAAVMALKDTSEEGIGALARRVASAAILGARGNAGVVLSQIFRGLSKGLLGKFHATSSEFGKAFQYGILYAQRVLPEEPERPIIRAARAVAKGAYRAVRANLPIFEILSAAVTAGEKPEGVEERDVGEEIMLVFLVGCQKGLMGNFVSPALNFSVGTGGERLELPDPHADEVHPVCLTFRIGNDRADMAELEAHWQQTASFVVVERRRGSLAVHLHTASPGAVLEESMGFGPITDIRLTDMADPHVAPPAAAPLLPVAVLAVAEDEAQGARLQEAGAHLIAIGDDGDVPSLGALVNAVHSDLAETYIVVADDPRLHLVLPELKRLLGERVEVVAAKDVAEAVRLIRAFDRALSAALNADHMRRIQGP